MSRVFLLAVAAALLAACASRPTSELVPFTDGLRSHYNLGAQDLRNLQYFISERVTLQRVAADTGHKVRDGRLVTNANRRVDTVVLPAHTPGVAGGVGGSHMEISFAEGSSFTFAPSTPGSQSPYRLVTAPDTGGGRRLQVYDDVYQVATDDGHLPYLLIDRETLQEASGQTYRLPGRRLDGQQ